MQPKIEAIVPDTNAQPSQFLTAPFTSLLKFENAEYKTVSCSSENIFWSHISSNTRNWQKPPVAGAGGHSPFRGLFSYSSIHQSVEFWKPRNKKSFALWKMIDFPSRFWEQEMELELCRFEGRLSWMNILVITKLWYVSLFLLLEERDTLEKMLIIYLITSLSSSKYEDWSKTKMARTKF